MKRSQHYVSLLLLSSLGVCILPMTSAFGIDPIGGYTVRCAYLIPADRSEQTNGVENYQDWMLLGQEWYADQMWRNGFGDVAFRLETEQDGITPKIWVVNLSEDRDELIDVEGNGDWYAIREAAIDAGVPVTTSTEVWILLSETQEIQSDGSIEGGIGCEIYSTAFQSGVVLAFSPSDILDTTAYDGETCAGLGVYDMVQDVTFGWWNGTTISEIAAVQCYGIIHEMTHAIGINIHSFRNETAHNENLMGCGYGGLRGWLYPGTFDHNYLKLTPAYFTWLTVNPYMNTPAVPNNPASAPSVSVTTSSGVATPLANDLIRINFTASDEDGLTDAFLFLNYDVLDSMTLSGTSVNTYFDTESWEPAGGDSCEYRVLAIDTFGNYTVSSGVIISGPASPTNRPPQPQIQIWPYDVAVNGSVELIASESYDPDDPYGTLSYEWDIDGDGTYDIGPTTNGTSYTSYNTAGRYYIRLRATDTDGGVAVSAPVLVVVGTPAIVDTTPPAPNPARFSMTPTNGGSTHTLAMMAVTGSDASGTVQYYFEETTGNPGGTDSGWQSSASYSDTGLQAGTTYTYRIKMRDAYQNETSWSTPENGATESDSALLDDGFESGFGNWAAHGTWNCTTDQAYSGSYSVHAGLYASSLTSNDLDTSGADSITIEFWYRDDDVDAGETYLQLYNGSGYTNLLDLNLATEDTWTYYTTTIENTGGNTVYFDSDFHIRFISIINSTSENLWIDDLLITAE